VSKKNELVFRFEPRTAAQAAAVALYDAADILFLLGPAGTGKTAVAAGLACRDVFEFHKRERIYITRPAVEAGEKLGFFPGTVDEKMTPWTTPIRDAIGKMIFGTIPRGVLTLCPLATMRGMTFENSVALLDEAQNCGYKQLKMFLTRLGRNSKIIVTGDTDQSDILPTIKDYACDLDAVADRVECLRPRVEVFEFHEQDVVRHPTVRKLLKVL
jgi:phosphate starvation-inducible PhoH-like protein